MNLQQKKLKKPFDTVSNITCVFLWLFFLMWVVIPLLMVLSTATKADFKEFFSSVRFLSALKNTFIECICSTAVSVFVGFVYAYAIVNGNIPFKKFFAAIPVVHMVTPPFVGGLSFILLFGRQGFITKTVLGLDISLYGFPGLLLSQILCFFPIAYLICSQTLQGINSSMEQAAKSLGASRWKIFKSITLPLSLSGITSSALFIAASVLSDFGNPLIVGGRFKVLAVEIYTQLTGWLNSGISSLLGLILLIPSVILFILQNKLMKKNSHQFATIGGKTNSFSASKNSVSKPVKILLTIFCSFFSILILAQLFSIIAGTFQKLWGIDSSFTLNHIKSIWRYSPLLFNSIIFAFISAIVATFIACLIAYFSERTKIPAAKQLNVVCQLPSAIPGTLMGLALSYFSNYFRIHSSPLLIIIAMIISYLPFSYRICSSTFAKIKINLDDASCSLGSGKITTLKNIIAPLSAGGLFSSFMYNFVRGVGTLSSVIFLVSFNTSLASVKILNLAEQGDWGKSAALALVLTLITFIILAIGKYFSGRLESSKWKNQQV